MPRKYGADKNYEESSTKNILNVQLEKLLLPSRL